jgi:hypothetical protein
MAMRYYAPFPGSGGDPARPRVPHALRIGDAERDAAAADLGEHYAAGRLTLDELHERLDAAFASKTLGQLTQVMADLPGAARAHWGSWPPGSGSRLGPAPYGGWAPASPHHQHYHHADGYPWHGPGHQWHGPSHAWQSSSHPPDRSRSRELQEARTPTDRAGRFAALSLLLLAMLIWLFTALLFARGGFYHPAAPVGPGSISHMYPHG